MSAETLQILYVGNAMDSQTFKECAEGQGWYVNAANTRLQALGMFINYFPQVVVLNALTDPGLIEEIYEHIRSVDSTPVIILATEWGMVDGATRVVRPDIPFSTLTFVIQELAAIFSLAG
ncbi:MAG TPA: hypothetical protein VKQ72_19670 [Aggregatilineales bacterium]|nr:hypothetical protein [Aggregatilineales bacterium]